MNDLKILNKEDSEMNKVDLVVEKIILMAASNTSSMRNVLKGDIKLVLRNKRVNS